MYDAVLLDFYGTVVHEDDLIVESICARIARAALTETDAAQVGAFWWSTFSTALRGSYANSFQSQRELERSSLVATLDQFEACLDPDELSAVLFQHWCQPPSFEDALDFLGAVDVPVVVVSNIDRVDLEAAIAFHGLSFEAVITSDDVRSYKPRPEIFEAALAKLGLGRHRVLHVGDSLTSDVAGASAVGIDVAWVNRKAKPAPSSPSSLEIRDLSGLWSLVPMSGPGRSSVE